MLPDPGIRDIPVTQYGNETQMLNMQIYLIFVRTTDLKVLSVLTVAIVFCVEADTNDVFPNVLILPWSLDPPPV
jgi:hypothetical protein